MEFVNEPSVKAALIDFYEDEHVQAMFKYAEAEFDGSLQHRLCPPSCFVRCNPYLVPRPSSGLPERHCIVSDIKSAAAITCSRVFICTNHCQYWPNGELSLTPRVK